MAKTGRPRKEFPWEIVDTACAVNADFNMIQHLLNMQGYSISRSLLDRAIKRKEGCTFDEYRNKRLDVTRIKLQQKAIQMAMSGHAVLMIFCLKNLCKWQDTIKEDVTVKNDNKTVVVYKTTWGSSNESPSTKDED
jgi:hypothetical protein